MHRGGCERIRVIGMEVYHGGISEKDYDEGDIRC